MSVRALGLLDCGFLDGSLFLVVCCVVMLFGASYMAKLFISSLRNHQSP